jgi:diguanylate cyclase (GGDEF)-like protein
MDGEQKGAFFFSALSAVLDGADEGIAIFDLHGTCGMIGRRVADLFGIDPALYVGRSRAELFSVLAAACDEPEVLYELAQRVGGAPAAAELEIVRPRPRKVQFLMYAINEEDKTVGTVVVFRDVTRERSADRARAQLQAQLDEVTTLDALTGLPNRRRFSEDVEREHGRSTRAWDSYAILRADVDEMRILNDEFGVPVGDAVLEKVAECLRSCRRDYDVIARFEDDEFIMLLPGADAVAAKAVGTRVFAAIDACDFRLPGARPITMSIGAAVWVPPSGESGADIVRRAGVALLRARSRGMGIYQFFLDDGDGA